MRIAAVVFVAIGCSGGEERERFRYIDTGNVDPSVTSTEASATASGSTGAPALSPRGAGVTSRSNSAPDTVGSATGSGATSSSAGGAAGTDSTATSAAATSSQSTTGAPLSPCDSVSACADEPECDYAVEFLQYHACKLDAYVCGD